MNRLSPRTTVLSGATIGLIAGAAIFGAVSSSATTKAPTALKAAKATATVSDARCAAGQELQKGVCIVHVEKTVVVPAPAGVSGPSVDSSASDAMGAEPSDDSAVEAEHESESDGPEFGDDATEHGDDAAEHASEAAEHAPGSDS